MFNQVTIDGIIYRASPCRTSGRQLNIGWNDWAYVSWGDAQLIRMEKVERTKDGLPKKGGGTTGEHVDFGNGDYPAKPDMLVPVHLLCFVRIDGSITGFSHNGRQINNGNYAVCHAVTQKQPQYCEGSILVKDVMKDKKSDNFSDSNNMIMYLIPVETIRKPCICVPNIRGPQKQRDLAITDAVPHRVDQLLIVPRSTWPRIFLKRMKERNEEGVRQRPVTWERHNSKNDGLDSSSEPEVVSGRAGKSKHKKRSKRKSKNPSNKKTSGQKRSGKIHTSKSNDDSTDSDSSGNEVIADISSNAAKRKRT